MAHTAKVFQVFAEKGYGVLRTPEGKEISFRKGSVTNYAFEHILPGTTVAYLEGTGRKRLEAKSVKVLGREGPHGTVHLHVA